MCDASRSEQQLRSRLGWRKCLNRDTDVSTEIEESHIMRKTHSRGISVRLSMCERPACCPPEVWSPLRMNDNRHTYLNGKNSTSSHNHFHSGHSSAPLFNVSGHFSDMLDISSGMNPCLVLREESRRGEWLVGNVLLAMKVASLVCT